MTPAIRNDTHSAAPATSPAAPSSEKTAPVQAGRSGGNGRPHAIAWVARSTFAVPTPVE
jgi:hypothetical protein